jgi:hypothetical protein
MSIQPLHLTAAAHPYGFDSAFLYVHFGPDRRVVAAEVTGG